MSKQSNADLFISELYKIGWDSPLDAQHRKITKLLGEWNEPLRNPEQLESSHSRTIEHLDKWISRTHKAEAALPVWTKITNSLKTCPNDGQRVMHNIEHGGLTYINTFYIVGLDHWIGREWRSMTDIDAP